MHFIENLFTVYDQCGAGDIDRTIIECLLQNLEGLEGASIYDVAMMANVSKTSISRFIRRLGLKSFAQFKFEMVQSFQKYKYHNRTLPMDCSGSPEEIRQNYLSVMHRYLDDLAAATDLEKMDRIVESIRGCRRVRFYTSHLGRSLTSFQTNLLLDGKDAQVLCDNASQQEDAPDLDKDTFLFITSAEFSDYGPIIEGAKGRGATIFLMSHGPSFYRDYADFCLVNHQWRTQISGHYYAMYLDILSALYRKKYLRS